MKITLWTKYNESYLPTSRHRKLRYREIEEFMEFDIKEVELKDLTPAFDTNITIFSYDGNLWHKSRESDIHCVNETKKMSALEALIYAGTTYSSYFGRYNGHSPDGSDREKREDVFARADRDMQKYLIVDGELYEVTTEPMYCVYTFGLGHNHANTSLFIVNRYNENISKERYFSALEFDKAKEKALDIARNRGDTNSISSIEGTMKIHVHDVLFVTRNPENDHGNGSEYINAIESVIEASGSAVEAGIIAMALSTVK